MVDLIKRRALQLGDIETLILDEADEMLNMGFIDDLEFIIKATPAERQTLLFSATMPDAIKKIGVKFMKDPQHVKIVSKEMTSDLIDQYYVKTKEFEKFDVLTRLIDVQKPEGNMIIDIGGGTTEIAVVALGGIVCDKSVKIAGDVFTNDIAYYLRTHHNLYIGERTAERVKIEVGSAVEELDVDVEDIPVQGRDLITGKPKEIMVGYKEIARALDKSIIRIEDAVMETLSLTPPELAADIYKTGIYLAGGGALLRGLADRLHKKTGLPVFVAEDPLRAVVRGTGIALKNMDKFNFLIK